MAESTLKSQCNFWCPVDLFVKRKRSLVFEIFRTMKLLSSASFPISYVTQYAIYLLRVFSYLNTSQLFSNICPRTPWTLLFFSWSKTICFARHCDLHQQYEYKHYPSHEMLHDSNLEEVCSTYRSTLSHLRSPHGICSQLLWSHSDRVRFSPWLNLSI